MKERFPLGKFEKLRPQADDSFIKKINDNTYKNDLLGDYIISFTFNAANLSSYYEDP